MSILNDNATSEREARKPIPVKVMCCVDQGLLCASLDESHICVPVHSQPLFLQDGQDCDSFLHILWGKRSGKAVQSRALEASAPLSCQALHHLKDFLKPARASLALQGLQNLV